MKDLKKMQAKIRGITTDRAVVVSIFKIDDKSVQSELRLTACWSIRFPADEIHAPKDLSGPYPKRGPWAKYREIQAQIDRVADLGHSEYVGASVKFRRTDERSRVGAAHRAECRAEFEREHGKAFLAAYRAATTKTALAKTRSSIEDLQAEQKALLPLMRAENSRVIMGRREASADRRANDAAALESGAFWDASKQALRDYFHPPFDRNYLAGVSERWKAALYVECESSAWKDNSGNWRHKLVATGRTYLCGVDDNGDEWGHIVQLVPAVDQYGNALVADFTVEEAMAELFDISMKKLTDCRRQGDLLFCPADIPSGTELREQAEPWEIRESHTVSAPGLERNGRYFRAMTDITVSHTSHEPVTLPSGSYRLYTLQVADAD